MFRSRRLPTNLEKIMLRKLFIVISVSFLLATGAFAQVPAPAEAPAPAAATKPKKPTFRSTKEQVKEAQTMLKAKSVFAGEVTGVSSAEWKTAVKTYQGDNGLTKTGSLNRATLEKMGIALTDKQKLIPLNPNTIASGDSKPAKPKEKMSETAKSTGDGPKRPAPFQATKEQITALQTKLKEAKLFSGEATGERSDELKDAIKKYQTDNSLKSTGGINAATLEKMGIALTDKQKDQVAAQTAYDAAKAPKK